MVAETAVSLALDEKKLPMVSGFHTPASALGGVLLERFREAGMVFSVDDTEKTD